MNAAVISIALRVFMTIRNDFPDFRFCAEWNPTILLLVFLYSIWDFNFTTAIQNRHGKERNIKFTNIFASNQKIFRKRKN